MFTVSAESKGGLIHVEVAYARPNRQRLVKLRVPAGTTVREAARLSGIRGEFPEIDLDVNKLGVFGRKVPGSTPVNEGDRVEIYRPLRADPKEVRRRRAAQGKTMGRKRART